MEARAPERISPQYQMENEMEERPKSVFGATPEEAEAIAREVSQQLKRERLFLGLKQQDVAEMSLDVCGGDKKKALSQRNIAYLENNPAGGARAAQYAATMGVSYALIVAKAETIASVNMELEQKLKR
jgi:hypothetical protein